MVYMTAFLVVAALANFVAPPAQAINFGGFAGDLLKVGGIAFIVSQFGGQINDGINKIMRKEGVMPAAATKVVPIIRMGTKDKTAVGAAQVVGPKSQVDKVKAVAEGTIRIGGFQGRVLIPVQTDRAVTQTVRGVSGVGISANIKISI